MKLALAIYTLLLVLEGLLAWHAGGSAFLLVASLCAGLLYALLCTRPGAIAEAARLIGSGLLVAVAPMYYGNNQTVLWLCLLALPHLLAATQCIWEIYHAGSTRDKSSAKVRLSIFTLGFYGALGLAFLLLRADDYRVGRAEGAGLALLVVLLSLVAWEICRVDRLKPGILKNVLTGAGFLGRVAWMTAGAVAFALLFAVVLPLAADALCQFSPKLKLPSVNADVGPPHKPPTTPQQKEAAPGDDSDRTAGPEITNRTGRAKLPQRAKLELPDDVRVLLKFDDAAAGAALMKDGPLYVRTLALSSFKEGEWESERLSGFWQKDSDDGAIDSTVRLTEASLREISHELFLPGSTGYSLPALAGVGGFALQELYVMPNDWFQIRERGDVRYRAFSEPKNILANTSDSIEPGSPGGEYLEPLTNSLGEKFQEIADFMKSKRSKFPAQLELVRQFFASQFRYSKTIENKENLDPLENFLIEERRGYCDFFATAGTLLLRHMGYPARIAFGYMQGDKDAASGMQIFRGYHAHSWTEIHIEGHGWVIFDLTPPSGEPPREGGALPKMDVAQFKPVGESKPPPLEETPKIEEKSENLWTRLQTLQALISPYTLGLAGVAALSVVIGFIISKRRAMKGEPDAKAARARAQRDKQPAYFMEFLKMCEALGHPTEGNQTFREICHRLKSKGFCADQFDAMAGYYYQVRYEDAPPELNQEQEFVSEVREFQKSRSTSRAS